MNFLGLGKAPPTEQEDAEAYPAATEIEDELEVYERPEDLDPRLKGKTWADIEPDDFDHGGGGDGAPAG